VAPAGHAHVGDRDPQVQRRDLCDAGSAYGAAAAGRRHAARSPRLTADAPVSCGEGTPRCTESTVECNAFAAGFTKYLDDHPDEHEGLGPLLKVLPIEGLDVLSIGLRAYYEFSYAGSASLTAKEAAKHGDKPDPFKWAIASLCGQRTVPPC